MELFFGSMAVVSGVLAPFALMAFAVWLLKTVELLLEARKKAKEIELEHVKKAAPYDEVQVERSPMSKRYTIRLVKDGQEVYIGYLNANLQEQA